MDIGEISISPTIPKVTTRQGFLLLDSLDDFGGLEKVCGSQVNLEVVHSLHAMVTMIHRTGNVPCSIITDTSEHGKGGAVRVCHGCIHGSDGLFFEAL